MGSLGNQAERMCLIMYHGRSHRPIEPDSGNADGGSVHTVFLEATLYGW
jgi:hypothetical protein